MVKVAIEVEGGDALAVATDVLVLKYAQEIYGVDASVVSLYTNAGRELRLPRPWGFRLEKAPAGVAAKRVLFVGVPPLRDFGYREIRTFARKALSTLAGEAPTTSQVAMTVHGVGYGLDEEEAFDAEIAGLVDAVQAGDLPESLKEVIIVERNPGRAKRLQNFLQILLPEGCISSEAMARRTGDGPAERLRAAGYASDAKAHVFVAMPFKEDMDDVFHYGIQSAVKATGLLCERADLSSFTGDVIEWVRNRIRSAALVVADLTDANPNVYLEVGFAWGVGVPTILVIRDTQQLKFDVRGQRCLVYRKIKQLEDLLTAELRALGHDA